MKNEINLITDEFVFDPLARIKPVLVAGWLVILTTLLTWGVISKGIEIRRTNANLVQLEGQLSQLAGQEADLASYISKNGQSADEIPFDHTIPWIDILSTIGTIVPEGAWLQNFEGGARQEVKDRPPTQFFNLSGFAYSHAPITLLLSRLERQTLFSEPHLIYTQKGETADDRYVHFEITGKLN